MSTLPAALLAAYQQRCHVEGESLEVFLDAVRGQHDAATLGLLLDRVEEDILQNIGLLLEANPALEAVARSRVEAQRARIASLRASLQ